MLTPGQLFPFYSDLTNPEFATHLAMVHSRFSTNTFPSWDRAQPNRFMSHNGEINTLRGNVNAMVARQGMVATEVFGDKLQDILPVIDSDCSDSGSFDSVLEFLLLSGRSLAEATMMMIPEAWQSDRNIAQAKKDFYEYHSALMEPWDGPASIVFSDGKYIGAVLDRNGLRPSRYYITHDDKCIMASEVGVLPVDPANVKFKGRLQPGKMFLIDFDQGRLIPDEEVKGLISGKRPYGEWLAQERITLADVASTAPAPSLDNAQTLERMQAFGYTTETMQFMLIPLVTEARDPLGSMGNDSALACLSDKPHDLRLLQAAVRAGHQPADRFDTRRGGHVLALFHRPRGQPSRDDPEQVRRLSLEHPVLSNQQLTDLSQMDHKGLRSCVVDITFAANQPDGFMEAVERICREASQAIEDGYAFIILSDRNMSQSRIPLSALIATGAVHQHLLNNELRSQIGIVVETGEAREVHHLCLLTGYGADAVNPYLAFEALWQANKKACLAINTPLKTASSPLIRREWPRG